MRQVLYLLIAAGLSPCPVRALDQLHFKNGETIEGKVGAITHETVEVHLSVALGGGKRGGVTRTYSLQGVDYIEFESTQEEARLLGLGGEAPRKALQKLWDRGLPYLQQPRSRTGRLGLLYAKVLLKSDSPYHWRQAKGLCELIAEKSWSKEDRDTARTGVVRVLVRQGELAKARRAAAKEIAVGGSERAVVEGHYLLAEIGMLELRQLQRENPKWEDDDELRPKRMRIYHETLDHFLDAYLFHATRGEEAARGLLGAATAYRFGGERERAMQCLRDAMQVYPSTPAGIQAEE